MRRVILLGVLAASALTLFCAEARGAAPRELSFQARLTDASGALVSDGNYDVTFRLYDTETVGTPLWIEQHTGANRAAVSAGVVTVALGRIASLDSVSFD